MHSNIKSKLSLLQQAYNETEKCNLLRYNCAALCGAACCKEHTANSASECGMSLFPSEKKLCVFDGARVEKALYGDILICSGKCDRALRPFMCRIFPFYAKFEPDVRKKGRERIVLVPDPRAFRICPVVSKKFHVRQTVYFHRYTRRAVRILSGDKDFKAELIKNADFAYSIYELYDKLLK